MKRRRSLSVQHRKPRFERLELRQMLAGSWVQLTNDAPTGDGIGTMMLLTDGTVMAQEAGVSNKFFKLTPDATGNYHDGTWTTQAPMSLERLYMGSNVLPSGKVFVLGGEYTGPSGTNNWINSGEIYDPVANTWSSIPNFPQSEFGDDPTVLLPNGKILAGYLSGTQTYLYNPATNTWAQTGSKLHNDASDEETWILLPDGSVLTVDVFANNRSQRYVPSTGRWVDAGNVPVILTGSSFGYEMGPATLLPDGRVFQVGANNNTAFYTPSTNTWTAGPSLPAGLGADDTPGVMLPNGHFLFAVDTSVPIFTAPTKLFDFDPVANTLTDVTSLAPPALVAELNGPAFITRMLMLPNGNGLFSTSSSSLWEYVPTGTVDPAWAPTVSSLAYNGSNTYTLTGTQLTGISEGASYGDDAEMSSNYPIVRLTSATGVVTFARSFNWTPGVATGSAVVTTQFTVPASLKSGDYTLNVIANGIASTDFPFTKAILPLELSLDTASINENMPTGTLVGTLSTFDPNGPNTFTYSLKSGVGDDNNSEFQLVGNQIRARVSYDFETQGPRSIRVKSTGADGLTVEKVFVISIRDVNEAPTGLTINANPVPENEPPGYVVGTFSSNDPDKNDQARYQLSATSVPNDNTLFRIQGNRLDTAVTFDYEARNTYTIHVSAIDQAGLTSESDVTIHVIDVNEKPTDLILSATELLENSPIGTAIGNFRITDQDANDSHTLTLVSGVGADDNARFTVVGKELRSNDNLDFERQTLYSIRVRATDANGLWIEKTYNISVLNVNEAPTGIALTPTSVDEGRAPGTTVGLLSTLDQDFGDTHKYELVDNVAFPDNLKFQVVGGELRTAAVFNFDVKNAYVVFVRSVDQGGLFIERTLTITVKNVNDPPSDIGISNRSITEDSPNGSLVGSFMTVDPDGSDTFTYQLVPGNGALNNSSFSIVGSQLFTNTTLNFETKPNYSIRVQSRDSGGVAIEKVFVIDVLNVNESPTSLSLAPSSIFENSAIGTVVGTLVTQDPDIADTFSYSFVTGIGSQNNGKFSIVGGSLRSNASIDYETTTTYFVRIKSTDAGGLSTEAPFVVSVMNVNEAPFNLNLSGVLQENTPVNAVAFSVTAVDSDAGDSLTYSLVAGPGADDNSKFVINATGGVSPLQPIDFETQSFYSIRVRATDVGGLTVEKAFPISVVDRNEAPTALSLSPNSLNENAGTGTPVGILATADPDASDSFQYSFVPGLGADNNASFSLVGNEIHALESFDFEIKNTYSVRVRTTDLGGLFTEKQLSILVENVNEAPVSIALANSTINEALPNGSLVGLLSTVDVDAGDRFLYSLVAGVGSTDNDRFAILNNQLQSATSFDFETKQSYNVRIRSTDRGGLSAEASYVISINDINELPTNMRLSSNSLSENLPIGTLIGLLTATDPDVGDSLAFRFVAGNKDNGKFSLSGNQLLSSESFDFESKSSYRVDIQAIDKSNNGPIQTFTITINDMNEATVDLKLSNVSIDENVVGGTLVGVLTAIDPDASDAHQFSLVSGEGDADNSRFAIVGNELHTISTPNFEVQSSYAIRVRGTDTGGLSYAKSFVVNVRDLPEAPSGLALNNFRIKENQGASAPVGTFSATDPDLGDTLTYSFATGFGDTNNGLFTLNNGNLSAKNSLDFEATPNLFARVRATDSTQQFTEDYFVIVVDNVNEAPTDITAPSKSVAENRPAGTVVSVLSTTDSDIGESYTYSLVPTPTTGDNIRFEIVGNELRTNRKLNFEAQSVHQLRIRSTDSTGLFVEVPFTVTVTDVIELAPIAAADTASTATNFKVVIDVLSNDQDNDGFIDPSTVSIVTVPTSGSVRILSDGRIEYTPATDQRLTATFAYTVKDNDEVVSNAASVSVRIFAASQNQRNTLDVDDDGSITPLDVLALVNDINKNGLRDLPNTRPSGVPYLDTNGNGKVDPLDVLDVVNYINAAKANGGEGESTMATAALDHAFSNADLDSLVNIPNMTAVDDYYQDLGQKRTRKR